MTDAFPRLLSVADAAGYCGVSIGLFRSQVMRNLTPLRIGGRLLIDMRALNAWLDKQSGIAAAETKDWTKLLDEDNN